MLCTPRVHTKTIAFSHICKLFKKSTKLLDPIMLADDTNLFNTNKNIKLLFDTVNKELHYVKEWFIASTFSLNAGKIKYLLFNKQSACDNSPLALPTVTFNSIDGAIHKVRTLI